MIDIPIPASPMPIITTIVKAIQGLKGRVSKIIKGTRYKINIRNDLKFILKLP
jgi:hypothetical protein